MMAQGNIQKYADAINQQVAAEAFLRFASVPEDIEALLVAGNRNNSLEPAAIAKQFNAEGRYKLIAHQELTQNPSLAVAGVPNKSGFSGSVFYDTQTQQYTFSIRSTEFAASIRDPGDLWADVGEIMNEGWAFGQIYSMEAFWSSLLNGTRHITSTLSP